MDRVTGMVQFDEDVEEEEYEVIRKKPRKADKFNRAETLNTNSEEEPPEPRHTFSEQLYAGVFGG